MNNTMRNIAPAAVLILALAAPLAGNAQLLKPNERPTNLPGATTIVAPPEGFDAINASDEDLAYHGFPPRPDQNASPKAYASWTKAINASKTRLAPALEQTNVFHGPAKQSKNAAAPSKANLTDAVYSYNWSGYVNLAGASGRTAGSFYYVYSDFVVPIARQAFGVANGTWDYGSSWVGIDGWGSGDVLQAGVEYDAYASIFGTSTYYSPWYEWYPYGEVRITNLPIAPGDDYFVEVWSTSATQGYAYLVNESTDQAVEIGFTAPAGTKLTGNSAEWIVERPGVNGSLATLTNYVDDVFWDSYAVTFSGYGYDPSSASSYGIIGLDNSGYAESYPTLLGPAAFLMQTEGSAY
jgi:hypothetical protein